MPCACAGVHQHHASHLKNENPSSKHEACCALRGLTPCMLTFSLCSVCSFGWRIDWFWKHLALIEITTLSLVPTLSWQLQSNGNVVVREMQTCMHRTMCIRWVTKTAAARWSKRMHQIALSVDKYQFAMFPNQCRITVMIPYKCKFRLNVTHEHTESHPYTRLLSFYFAYISFSFFHSMLFFRSSSTKHRM